MKTDITDNFLVIQGWMLTKLGLKGSELFVYALIYGFSQDGISTFIGSVDYIQEWIGASSRQTVYNAINKLMERGLIIRREFVQANGVKGVEYYAVTDEDGSPKNGQAVQKMDRQSKKWTVAVQKMDREGPKNGQRQSKKWTATIKDNINNNYNNTIGDNNTPSSAAADVVSESDDGDQIIEIKRTSPPSAAALSEEFEALWTLYPRKEGKEQARRAYVSARRSGVSADTIRAGIVAYNERIDREQIGMRYIAHGGNWFEGRRWEDANTPAPLDLNSGTRCKPLNRAVHGYKQRRYTEQQLIDMGVIDMSIYEDEEAVEST